MSDGERRSFGRTSCRLRVRFGSADHLKEHYITDIGEGGVFVETAFPLEIGASIDLEILVGEDSKPFMVQGEVAWVRSPSNEGRAGMGIRFLGLTAEVRERLAGLLAAPCRNADPGHT